MNLKLAKTSHKSNVLVEKDLEVGCFYVCQSDVGPGLDPSSVYYFSDGCMVAIFGDHACIDPIDLNDVCFYEVKITGDLQGEVIL